MYRIVDDVQRMDCWFPVVAHVKDLRSSVLIWESQCYVYCAARCHLTGEGAAKCTGVCALSELNDVLSTQVGDNGVTFAKSCLYLNSICGY